MLIAKSVNIIMAFRRNKFVDFSCVKFQVARRFTWNREIGWLRSHIDSIKKPGAEAGSG